MSKYQITLEILGRQFPVNVTESEEERIRLVAQLIEDKLQTYRSRYEIKDEVYLALMACMDITSEYLKVSEQHEQAEAELLKQLSQMNARFDAAPTNAD